MKLVELARTVRSKNAGPLKLTLDLLFDDEAAYRRAPRQSANVNQEAECGMLAQLGNFAVHQGRYSVARGMHREALELARDIGARSLGGGFLNNLGETDWLLGNYDAAFDLFQTAHHLCRKMDLVWAQPNPCTL